jgi:hypothetical protein
MRFGGSTGARLAQQAVIYTVNRLCVSAIGFGVANLIVTYPRHAPYATVGSPQYKDGTSMAAPDPKHTFLRLWKQAGDIYGESTLRIGNRLVLPV